jgi:hypothetical protein
MSMMIATYLTTWGHAVAPATPVQDYRLHALEKLADPLRAMGHDPVVLHGGMGATARAAARARLQPQPQPGGPPYRLS